MWFSTSFSYIVYRKKEKKKKIKCTLDIMALVEQFTNLTVPSSIYKDDCGYCFETMYNSDDSTNHHLNICLSCFQSFCVDHVQLHQSIVRKELSESHDLYLKLKKTRKPEVEEQRMEKKLKLEVKEQSEDEIYETKWWVVQIQNGSSELLISSDSTVDPVVQRKVSQIIHARSSDFTSMAQSWELEIKPCVHVKNLHTPSGDPKVVSSHCDDCNLSNNLWLCLQCGNIGCGREQVGIEGNSHALKHYQQNSQHSLAVKLGSLSASTADIYCYACDEEVRFDDEQQWVDLLSHWGIDLHSRTAQEKTLVELQVEQNMNWDFQMVDSKGNELKHLPASKEYGCGLNNLGNSCYMNSVLQVLFNGAVPDWSLEVLGDFPRDVVYPSTNLKCQLIKLRNAIKRNPSDYTTGIKPSTFKRCIGESHEEFSSGRQQDAMEFFTYFIDELDKKLFSRGSNPNDQLRFTMEDRLECNNCHCVKYTEQVSEAIQIPLVDNDEKQDLCERIRAYFQGEVLEFKCPGCNATTTATKSSGFKTFPNTLIVNPVRIKLENWIPVKTNNELEIPGVAVEDDLKLSLSEFKSLGFNKDTEKLMPDDEHDSGFQPNESSVNQLIEMGFTKNAATRALFNTGNGQAETAMDWLFQHMDDPDLNMEFVAPVTKSKHEVSPESLENMVSMGLDPKLCRKALLLNNGDINTSVEWVFNNMDDDGELEEENQESSENAREYGDPDASLAQYTLRAVICHKGNSVQSGHYVAFIKKNVDGQVKWVLYNDEKIVVADDIANIEEIKKNGYVYLFSK